MQFYHLFGCLYVLTYHYSSANVSHVLQSFFFLYVTPPIPPMYERFWLQLENMAPKRKLFFKPQFGSNSKQRQPSFIC